MSWFNEYQYRRVFPGINHDDYLDHATREERSWMLRIHELVEKHSAKES